jgi:acetylornithine deacetylase
MQLIDILKPLAELVACDTRNPPQKTDASGIFDVIRAHLPGFRFEHGDAGDGAQWLLAVRGKPSLLFNFHVDTVPDNPDWSRSPFVLHQEGGKVYGLGACDIKGASACMLAAVAGSEADVALLFSTDEEAGDSRALHNFLALGKRFDQVVVAEPTMAQAVSVHRGYLSNHLVASGEAGHSSEPRALHGNAIHQITRWLAGALAVAEDMQAVERFGLKGICLNAGIIEGGIKNNIIAPSASLKFGFRPLPGQSAEEVLAALPDRSAFEVSTGAQLPSLPAAGGDPEQKMAAAQALIEQLGLPAGDPVAFWTEASLFSEAGMTAIVFGPGHIAQAHTADEWVAEEQLLAVANHYRRILAQA